MNLSVTVCSCYRNRPFFYRCRPVSAAPVRSKSHSGTAEQRNANRSCEAFVHSARHIPTSAETPFKLRTASSFRPASPVDGAGRRTRFRGTSRIQVPAPCIKSRNAPGKIPRGVSSRPRIGAIYCIRRSVCQYRLRCLEEGMSIFFRYLVTVRLARVYPSFFISSTRASSL